MRAIILAVVVLGAVVGGTAWWLGPDWNLGQAIDRAGPPLAAIPGAATAVALVPGADARARATPTAVPASPVPVPRPTASPEPGTQAVTVTEDGANEYLSTAAFGQELANTPFGPITIEDVRVRFRPGEMVVNGAARAATGRLAFVIVGTLTVEGGNVRAVVREARLNDLPLPSGLRVGIEQALSEQVAAAARADGVRVSAVEIGDRVVTVRVARPSR